MQQQINNKLQKICENLGGKQSLNYSCNIKVFTVKTTANQSTFNILNSINELKNEYNEEIKISEVTSSNVSSVLEEFENCLNYEGEEHCAYPNKEYFNTKEFKEDIEIVKNELKILFQNTDEVLKFWFDTGHPFYPVFWDFSFLLKEKGTSYLIVGSSSD